LKQELEVRKQEAYAKLWFSNQLVDGRNSCVRQSACRTQNRAGMFKVKALIAVAGTLAFAGCAFAAPLTINL
jgi:hypothetical protein